jgi:hypothetical protein
MIKSEYLAKTQSRSESLIKAGFKSSAVNKGLSTSTRTPSISSGSSSRYSSSFSTSGVSVGSPKTSGFIDFSFPTGGTTAPINMFPMSTKETPTKSAWVDVNKNVNDYQSGNLQHNIQDIKLSTIFEEAQKYGQIDNVNIGMTDDGRMVLKDLQISPQYEEGVNPYATYGWMTGHQGVISGQKATIWDYAMGYERMELSPTPYVSPTRDYVYDYQGYQRFGTSGFYDKPMTNYEYQNYYLRIGRYLNYYR